MRVLHVIAGAKTGGAETFAQDAITALAARGIEQRVLTRPHTLALARFAEAGVPVETLGFSHLDRWLGAPMRIRKLATEFRADIVHAWMGRAASFVPARMPCPVIGWFGGPYDLKYYRTSDFFVGVTHDIARHIVASGGGVNRTLVVHTFGTLPEGPPVRRVDLDTPEDAPVLLTLSRMHRKKGIDTLLQALASLPGAYLWLAGDGPDLAEYQDLAKRLGLSDRVRFLGWRTDRRALLEAADICVLPSRYEPFGTVIVEAWSTRRPLVATMADGARQYVRDGHDGLLCPIDDVSTLTQCLARVIADPSLRESLVANGEESYRRTFHRDVVIERLVATYGRATRIGPRAAATTVDIRTLDQSLVDDVAADLADVDADATRIRDAAQAAVAHAGGGVRETDRAPDAALLALSGAHSFAVGGCLRQRITLWRDEEFDIAAENVDLPALRTRYGKFLRPLADRLHRRRAA